MSLYRRAQNDLWAAAEALIAYRRGEDEEGAMVGALLIAEEQANIRAIINGLSSKK